MDHKASSLLSLAVFFLLFISSATAFNITKLLGTFPEFSNLNSLLLQNKLNDEINSRRTITVLAVDNSALSSLSGKPNDLIKKVLSAHVILDYYDVEKLTKAGTSNKTTMLTTLFQASGQAVAQEGFINVGLINEGEIAFGSAVKGANLDSKLVKSVAAQPFNISVLQITKPIAIPGIDSSASQSPSSAPVPAPKSAPPAKSPVPSTPKKAPAAAPVPAKSKAPAPSAETPVAESPADTPVEAPESDAPSADAPTSDAPVSDAPSDAPGPAGSDVADGPKKSGGSRTEMMVGAAGVLTALVSYFVAL
ncbi:fasciclin-like arabinogalactan protein 14 [Ziziphus jujuba]|uniref:Fasciclin-like arabinogalactan protein 14 n=1 Tax=Ziziphus jujuba TaxID=326968 RepID=A0A6P4AAY1_ZIZJJ|nr:fasciclin-like arabinogalactan protein 14 [Ziziphus jujuba]